ncbi:NAD-dependent epimerase/dehydratase family protein [Clostridium saccharoperbutylacetonicum]|uniref:NAD-dependent epimerase/dehydratase family protein n=1 Tax=Clostridium saccharoperbutylacetonicum TaxID=36745 RepID=UPI000983EAF5|nr:NAD(P)-dependent oxidoreductase [Clostridium saccharoperbutylacetonicum]AQR96986.1 GDP-6-deoxy-D-mannose reductase [Clostridium saccharoperbutylacetonicum]NSB32865.1 nucleoside-diphosphate-sugar epimerase [Clostridium saccharoperbutylacetonicum]
MKKVIVTGSSGFIGKALTKKLYELNYEVIKLNSKTGDISDFSTFSKFDFTDINHIYHLAGKTFVPDSWENPLEFYKINAEGTLNILELCRKYKIELTYISAYVYGHQDFMPISEDVVVRPNNPYAHSKYIAEQLCEFYAYEYGVKVSVIRPFNVFGVGQNEKFLIPHIIKQALLEDNIKVKDLTPKRDYIYIDDLIDAIILTKHSKNNYNVYNIGSGYSISVKEIIDVVQEILDISKPINCENSFRINEISDVVANISRANLELNWFPQYSFIDGIREILKYEKEKYNGEV